MFTGLISQIGTVQNITKTADGAKFAVKANFDDLKIGDSIAVSGVCQTITAINGNIFEFAAMNETLKHTNFSMLKCGSLVNLERAMCANGRFDGHIVTGHVDDIAKLLSIKNDGISKIFKFEFDTKYIVKKGSICINGVSLTVSDVEADYFEVSLIPHTLQNTNLGSLNVGDFVNIENDVLAKYIEKFAQNSQNSSKIDENFLRECGF